MDDMDELERQIKLAEARSRLAALDDDTLVSDELACVYLNISPKQLKNLRTEEDGPGFFKPVVEGAKKANQAVSYDLGTLRGWKAKHTFKNNLDVATRSIRNWVGEPQPFFTEDVGRNKFSILAPADDITRDDWGDRLASAIEGGAVHVDWLVPAEAAAGRWNDFETHKRFANDYLAELDAERGRIAAALGSSELGSLI
jgi:hypothetical protein